MKSQQLQHELDRVNERIAEEEARMLANAVYGQPSSSSKKRS